MIIWTMLLPQRRVRIISSTRLRSELRRGPVKFKVLVQIANDGDVVDDATVHWPEDRNAVLELGTIVLTAPVAGYGA